MNVDEKNILYQKIGVTISNLALSLLSQNTGDRIKSISQYQEEFEVSRGTVQNAMNYLKEIGAVLLVPHGHLGTYIEEIDYTKLQECCLTRGLMGIMPLPYSSTYEGFATAMYEQLNNFRFNMAYARGAVGRMELVESGTYQFAICSKYAVEHEIKAGKNIEIALDFGVGSFLSRHVLLLKEEKYDGITDGMRVAYDQDSLDQSWITQTLVKGKKVELVKLSTQQTGRALLEGIIDAGVWNYDAVIENHHLSNLKVVFLNEIEYGDAFSTAVLVVQKDNLQLKKVLKRNISVKGTLKIQEEVKKGERSPFY